MEFIKKNYEKVILGAVLLVLAIAACALPLYIQHKRDDLEARRTNNKPKVKELPPVDLAVQTAALQRAQSPWVLDFTSKHNLFNPVVWKKSPDGRLIKENGDKMEGPDALEVTNIKELYLIISYGSASGNGYLVSIERQAAPKEGDRHTQNYVSKETKSKFLALNDVKGTPEKPELNLVWNETGEEFTITPDKPFKRVDGYAADLKYPLEPGKVWTDRRQGSAPLNFANALYKIVVITQSNVVVSAESNNKKTTIKFHPATESR